MFVLCPHCHFLVGVDPRTGAPPPRCPKCGGALEGDGATSAAAASDPLSAAAGHEDPPAVAAMPTPSPAKATPAHPDAPPAAAPSAAPAPAREPASSLSPESEPVASPPAQLDAAAVIAAMAAKPARRSSTSRRKTEPARQADAAHPQPTASPPAKPARARRRPDGATATVATPASAPAIADATPADPARRRWWARLQDAWRARAARKPAAPRDTPPARTAASDPLAASVRNRARARREGPPASSTIAPTAAAADAPAPPNPPATTPGPSNETTTSPVPAIDGAGGARGDADPHATPASGTDAAVASDASVAATPPVAHDAGAPAPPVVPAAQVAIEASAVPAAAIAPVAAAPVASTAGVAPVSAVTPVALAASTAAPATEASDASAGTSGAPFVERRRNPDLPLPPGVVPSHPLRRRTDAVAPSFALPRAGATPVRHGWRWPAAVALLSLLLVLQLLLAQRDTLAADARWRPAMSMLCAALRCTLPPWREPTAFTMLSRDVRAHPSAPGALLVHASFRNDARWPQPWPRLVLTLSNIDGRIVGARAFAAREYLGTDAAATPHALAPGQTAAITLAVVEPAPDIVAFSFDFR